MLFLYTLSKGPQFYNSWYHHVLIVLLHACVFCDELIVCCNVIELSDLNQAVLLLVQIYLVCQTYNTISRLTIVSHEAKKKQYMRPLSELFTCSTALKLANALAKPP